MPVSRDKYKTGGESEEENNLVHGAVFIIGTVLFLFGLQYIPSWLGGFSSFQQGTQFVSPCGLVMILLSIYMAIGINSKSK